ncbi:MAG: hypothetical protein HDT18_07045 [Oscillibacter sp.]|nr:hypothetical protein [Oscillibacter sp.]
MTREENATRKHRIPAAALVAAILVIALAGTAVAEGLLGRVSVSPGTSDGGSGHTFHGNFQTVPLESLSEELLAYSKSGEWQRTLAFDSWTEAEEFIGVEVANNSRLEQTVPMESGFQLENMPEIRGNCLVTVTNSQHLPASVRMKADYHDDNADIHIFAVLKISEKTMDTSFSIGNAISGDTWTEETYVTPNGMEVTILTTEKPMTDSDGSPIIYTQYEASFATNNAFFYLRSAVGKGKSADRVLAALKEVLDAYE